MEATKMVGGAILEQVLVVETVERRVAAREQAWVVEAVERRVATREQAWVVEAVESWAAAMARSRQRQGWAQETAWRRR